MAGKLDGLSISAQPASGASGAAAGAKSAGRKPGPMGTVLITKQTRTKKKSLTCVSGLDEFGVKLKDLAKILGKKFACGAAVVEGSVPGSEEIAIQGDFQQELADFIAGTRPRHMLQFLLSLCLSFSVQRAMIFPCVFDATLRSTDKVKEVPKGRIFFIEKLKKSRAFPEDADDGEANEETLISDAQAIIDDL